MASKQPESTEVSRSGHEGAQDWQVGKKVLECNKYMFENAVGCDVTFTFPPPMGGLGQKVTPSLSAHKYVLISRSPVFYAMLLGPAHDESGEISIEDINMESFKEMLRLLTHYWTFSIHICP